MNVILRAAFLASGAAWLLSTHVFVAIDRERVKLVQSPVMAVDGRVRVMTDSMPDLERLGPPFALIARVRNQSTSPGIVEVQVDGIHVCERRVPGDVSRRLDCAVTFWSVGSPPAGNGPISGTSHLVTIAAKTPSAVLTLEYLELASHFGNTSGANYLVILPASANRYVRPRSRWIVMTWLAVFLTLVFSEQRPVPGWIDVIGRTVIGVVVALLVVIQFADWFSTYRIVLPAGTFGRLIALGLASRLWFAGRWLAAAEAPAPSAEGAASRLVPLVRAGLVALAVFAVYDIVTEARLKDSYGGNYSGFLLISETTFDENPLLRSRKDVRSSLAFHESGYDGEFMYFAVFDPFVRAFKNDPVMYRQVMDNAPYRFGRIGFSWLTWIFSAGRWERYPATMIWLILASLALASFILAFMAQEEGLTPAVGGLVIVIPGFWDSLQSGLPEPVAAATLLGGLFLLSRRKPWLAGSVFALSLLIRETGAVIVGGSVVAAIATGRRRDGAIVALFAGGMLLAWYFYVAWVLFPDWGVQRLLDYPSNLGAPFAGVRHLWQAIGHGEYYSGVPELSRAAIAYPVLLVGAFLLAVWLAVSVRNATAIVTLIYAIEAISLNFQAVWLHVGSAQRVTYELFVMLALSCLTIRAYSRPLRTSLIAFWWCSFVYAFFLTFDASYIRSALGFPI